MKSLKYIIFMMMLAGPAFSQSAVTNQNLAEVMSEDELPAVGVRYYYYPNLQAYFDTHTNLYLYKKDGNWIKSPQMASGYRGYSVMNTVRVEITDYNGDQPQSRLDIYKERHPANYSAKRKPPKDKEDPQKLALN